MILGQIVRCQIVLVLNCPGTAQDSPIDFSVVITYTFPTDLLSVTMTLYCDLSVKLGLKLGLGMT